MTTLFPRCAPDTSTSDEPQPYGAPSAALMARAESGFEKFLERIGEGEQDAEEPEQSSASSFFHEDVHPWLHKKVRDVASRGEGELTAVVHEKTNGRVVRVAYIRATSNVEWTTAADNIQLVT
ncbi:hypothetical protein [Streptomyces vilmorinianum]|uniref:hypothetical protein n=1 Tax=Streptomyces vilmorinianum TaxID=3051092 RepID=UPI0010FB544D|nr:hypothetical protein [Streptomyces vilmorinianum]